MLGAVYRRGKTTVNPFIALKNQLVIVISASLRANTLQSLGFLAKSIPPPFF
jgi:hypothetical protein